MVVLLGWGGRFSAFPHARSCELAIGIFTKSCSSRPELPPSSARRAGEKRITAVCAGKPVVRRGLPPAEIANGLATAGLAADWAFLDARRCQALTIPPAIPK